MLELRTYQEELSVRMYDTLKRLGIVYLSAEVRTGKTATSLETCKKCGAKNVLFLTKKKAISSIEKDYKAFGFDNYFNITVINYESLHKMDGAFDLLVIDESHVNGAFPKPNKTSKLIKLKYSHLPMILLSGTPAVESSSQWFHQFWISLHSPFKSYGSFYKWANDFVDVFEVNFGNGYPSKNYSKARTEQVLNIIEPYLITFTQKDAGFETSVKENILYSQPLDRTKAIAKQLIKDRVVNGKDDVILADTPVKLMSKLHQIWNGTCIGESGNIIFIDDTKIDFIRNHFEGKKIALFYYFKAELELIKKEYGDNVTTDLEEFNITNKNIALQQSGLEGINLSKADYIVYYNFGFSGKNLIQSLDRMTTMNRKSNDVYFVFERGGMSEKVYKAVSQKKNYNIKLFSKDFLNG